MREMAVETRSLSDASSTLGAAAGELSGSTSGVVAAETGSHDLEEAVRDLVDLVHRTERGLSARLRMAAVALDRAAAGYDWAEWTIAG